MAGDDDSGEGPSNFRIEQTVQPGTYYVWVFSAIFLNQGINATRNYIAQAELIMDYHADDRDGATALPLGGSVEGRIGLTSDVGLFRVVVLPRRDG